MNNIDRQYKELLDYILHFGVEKQDRTGTGTKSIFGWQIRHNMKEGFPLLTTKKMAWKTMVTELLWFLRGDTNIKYLVDNGCHIWDGDAYKRYYNYFDSLEEGIPHTKEEFIGKIKSDDEFAEEWGELGPIYGKQWRQWQGWVDAFNEHPLAKGSIWYDQIGVLIQQLKTNPDSRRLMVNAWNVGELDQMVLPPCHYGFQVYTRYLGYNERCNLYIKKYGEFDIHPFSGKDVLMDGLIPERAISLMWNQRSVDTFLGLPFNIASYALLLEIIAKEVNMIPDELIGNLGDTHLYLNHIEQAKEQITRTPYELPKVIINDEFWNPDSSILNQIEHITPDDFIIENYYSHPAIKAPLSN